MIRKNIILFGVCWLCLAACDKPGFDDLGGTFTVKGIVVSIDTLNGAWSNTPQKNTTVYLKYEGDATGFIKSFASNAQGEYTFNGLDPTLSYVVYARVDTGAVKYFGEVNYPANGFKDRQSDSLKLFAAPLGQNGVHLLVEAAGGGRLAGVTAWVFSDSLSFAAGTADGKLFDMVTNTFGIANKFNIAPGKYFFRVKTKIGERDLQGTGNVVVETNGIKNVPLTLDQFSPNKNGFEVTVIDEQLTPVQTCIVYVYRSRSVFELDSTFTNSLFAPASNADGIASQYNIPPATYLLRAIKVIGKDTLKAEGEIDVEVIGISKKPLMITPN